VSDSQTVREWLQATLTPLIPTAWAFIPNQKLPETIARVTVFLTLKEIEPLPEAPTSTLRNTITLTIVSPLQDEVKAENALDDDVLALVTALDGHPRMTWSKATKVLVRDPYIGWDITLAVISAKTITDTP
jgi:hypothetical protein